MSARMCVPMCVPNYLAFKGKMKNIGRAVKISTEYNYFKDEDEDDYFDEDSPQSSQSSPVKQSSETSKQGTKRKSKLYSELCTLHVPTLDFSHERDHPPYVLLPIVIFLLNHHSLNTQSKLFALWTLYLFMFS